ncbi:bifunctional glycosyltransferase/CDP-glycerol:glycerophosphate glycerophosphotransferase [Glutamicibacter arilaitensis]|uniref:bifunctional glycosyltransferase/CDP-glycerol:glycerophosphate glycerophosphotransferase n=1 Tax=Glutamicibacter arilaitensis TaxID=256701 RepID=UPI003F910B64
MPLTDHPSKPLFSVLMAVYNVEEYIEGTFKSLLNQSYPFDELEIIIVDDGSTDSSPQIARQFAEIHPNVTYLRQQNGGPGAARSAGLERATGTWVTVVDPDDILDKAYFAEVKDFIDRDKANAADLMITNIIVMNGSTASLSDTHPLNFRFKNGDRLYSLEDQSDGIQLGATAFLRLEILKRHNLTYDPRIEPTFEDAHLLGRYLSHTEKSVLGTVSRAKYYYRKRADQSSLVQSGWEMQERYTSVLRHGYLDLLRQVKLEKGFVPTWTQNSVLYDLIWYFKEESKMNGKTSSLLEETKPEFLELLNLIFAYIDVETIENFALHNVWWSLKQAILARYKGVYDLAPVAFQWGENSNKGGNKYSIVSTLKNSDVQVYLNGILSDEFKINYVNHSFFGSFFFTEINIEILGKGHVRMMHDGYKIIVRRAAKNRRISAPVTRAGFELAQRRAENRVKMPARISKRLTNTPLNERRIQNLATKLANINNRVSTESLAMGKSPIRTVVDAWGRKREAKRTNLLDNKTMERLAELKASAANHSNRTLYKDAWIVMDRPLTADDNGEHFYRYLNDKKPEVNAWFLLSESSKDWSRLKSEGFKLLDLDSDDAFFACENATHIISSDAVREVMYPVAPKHINYARKKFIFLQHGVIKDDLSAWLNGKDITAIVTSTKAEYESFVGKESPYQLNADQVMLTGLARHDALSGLRSTSVDDLIVIMPTWRMSLRDTLADLSGAEAKQEFAESEFGKNWIQLLNSVSLKNLSNDTGKKIVFIPHPSLTEFIDYLDLPDYVTPSTQMDATFQDILARASLYITDYSSVAFDAAVIDVPVVYFQFDKDTFFAGHSYSKGYFDYESHGFGVVAHSCEDALQASVDALLSPKNLIQFAERRKEAFPNRDGNNCLRTYEAIVAL